MPGVDAPVCQAYSIVVVWRRTCAREVASSTPGWCIAGYIYLYVGQLSLPSLRGKKIKYQLTGWGYDGAHLLVSDGR